MSTRAGERKELWDHIVYLPVYLQENCNLNATNAMALQTPLHLAAQEGYTRVIERLIGYGADPNLSGNTPLSDVIRNRGIIKTPSEDSPQTLQVLTLHVLTYTCGIHVYYSDYHQCQDMYIQIYSSRI